MSDDALYGKICSENAGPEPNTNNVIDAEETPKGCHISKLPRELLSEIFFCCSAVPTPNLCVSQVDPHLPLTLSHVCGDWRTVSFSRSALWSFIVHSFLEEKDITKTAVSRATQLTQHYVTNSRKSPLHIVLQCPLPYPDDEYYEKILESDHSRLIAYSEEKDSSYYKTLSPLFEVLLPEAYRWAHIRLYMGSFLMDSFIARFPTSLPILSGLALNPEVALKATSYLKCISAPVLRHLSLDLHPGVNADKAVIKALVESTQQLQTFWISNIDVSLALQFLQWNSPSVELQIMDLLLDDEPLPSLSVVCKAQTLSLAEGPGPWGSHTVEHFLPHISLPNLVDLSLMGNQGSSSPLPFTSFHKFLSDRPSSHSSITQLKLLSWSFTTDHLIQILTLLPHLTALIIAEDLVDADHARVPQQRHGGRTLSQAFFAALEIDHNISTESSEKSETDNADLDATDRLGCLLPRLNLLDLFFSSPFDASPLIRVIESRKVPTPSTGSRNSGLLASLEGVCVGFLKGLVSDEDKASLASLGGDGFNIAVEEINLTCTV